MVYHAALENNQAYLMRVDITESRLNNRICQLCGVKTSTATPSFYYVYNTSLSCNNSIPSFMWNLRRVLLLGNHLNTWVYPVRVRKWSQDRKWSRAANDPQIGPQMIPDRKCSPYWTSDRGKRHLIWDSPFSRYVRFPVGLTMVVLNVELKSDRAALK